MAAYNSNPGPQTDPASSDDYFSDSPAGEQDKPEEKDDKDEYSGTTAVLPKEILAGKEFKPGEEVVLEIVRINDDSVEVKYASDKGEKEEGGEPPEPGEEAQGGGYGGDKEMQSMME